MTDFKILNDTEDEEIKNEIGSIEKLKIIINMIKFFIVCPIQFYLKYHLEGEEGFESLGDEEEIIEEVLEEIFEDTKLADEMQDEGIIDSDTAAIERIKGMLIRWIKEFETDENLEGFRVFDYIKNIILGQMNLMSDLLSEIEKTESVSEELEDELENGTYALIGKWFCKACSKKELVNSKKQEQD